MAAKIEMFNAVMGALDASGTVLLTLEGRQGELFILDANDAFRRAGDYEAARLPGTSFATLVSPDSLTELGKLVEVSTAGRSFRGELACLGRSGRVFWFGLHVMPAARLTGQPRLFVVLGRDITQRKLESEQSAALQSLLAQVFMTAAVPLSMVDAQGRMAMTNEAHQQLLGGTAEDWVGKVANLVLHPDDRVRVRALAEQQLIDRKSFRTEARLLKLDGTPVPVTLSTAAMKRQDRVDYHLITILPHPEADAPEPVEPVADRTAARSALRVTPVIALGGKEEQSRFVQLREWFGRVIPDSGGAIDASHLERDLSCLRQALEEGVGPAMVALEFEHFMQRHSRERLLNGLRELPPAGAKLTLMLDNLPRAIAPARVTDAIQRLTPFGVTIGVFLPDLETPSFSAPDLVYGILATGSGREGASATLQRYCAMIHTRRGKVWLRNAEQELLRPLAMAGVDYVSFKNSA